MDPDAALTEICRLTRSVHEAERAIADARAGLERAAAGGSKDDQLDSLNELTDTLTQAYSTATRLAEHVDALNAWLSNGGFSPARWSPVDHAAGAEPERLDPALQALAVAVADRLGLPTETVTAAMLNLDGEDLWARFAGPAVDELEVALFPGTSPEGDCLTCRGRRWLHMLTNGDHTRYWIERCDDCAPADFTDADAAQRAALVTGYAVGWARPANCDHEHPYLVDVPDECIARVEVPPPPAQ